MRVQALSLRSSQAAAPPAERTVGWAPRCGLARGPPAASPQPPAGGQGKDFCTKPKAATAALTPQATHTFIFPLLAAVLARLMPTLGQQQRRKQRKPKWPQDTLAKATGVLRVASHGTDTAHEAAEMHLISSPAQRRWRMSHSRR